MTQSRGSQRKKKIKPPAKIVVNSKTYGIHERAARGTVTAAALNESMKAYGERLIKSNTPAKLILEALKPFRTNFRGGQFWQQLVKHFAAQANIGTDYSVVGLQDRDVHNYYTSSRIMTASLEVQYRDPDRVLETTFRYVPETAFRKRVPYVNAFQITIIALFPDFEKNTITTFSETLPPVGVNDPVPVNCLISIPEEASQCLIGYKIEGMREGKLCSDDTLVARCIRFTMALLFKGGPSEKV